MDLQFDDLTEGQKKAYLAALDAVKTKTHLTINGPAGTGKTTLTKFFINSLIKDGQKGIQLAAPTHQARKVLSKMAGINASTIHSLLKINPTTYEDVSSFEQSDVPDLSECSVLICDEISMYDRKLFKILMDTVPSHCTIIGLGDMAQLRPVAPDSSVSELSAFFLNPKFKQISLTDVVRSNVPIVEVATEIRQGGWIRGNVVDGEGVHNLSDGTSPIHDFMKKYFSIVKTPEDLFENRILAYTNKSVDTLNKIVRKHLYKTEVPFIIDEVLVMQEPLMKTTSYNGKKFTEVVLTNSEMVKIVKCEEVSYPLTIFRYPNTEMIKIWKLDVVSLDSGVRASIKVIDDEKQQNIFGKFMSKVAQSFKDGSYQGKPNWKAWWELKNQFSKVRALPCGTIHKSQGTSVDNTFLYTPCIHRADSELAQQLLYVGCTRARNNVYYI